MSLIAISKKSPEEVSNFRVDQVLMLAGDGKLRDGSICSFEFKQYLTDVSLDKLAAYVKEVLENKLQDGGFVLQDLINEIGRRLGFLVRNGRYHGVAGQIGHDGYWANDQMRLVVEVKTTDAYRINLSTLANYAKKIHEESDHQDVRFGILVVVGRQDTGDLEAQIRGSKFAWDIRVISAEALIDLTKLFSVSVDLETSLALQQALLPVEYTRVDHLVDLLSRLAFDVERSVTVDNESSDLAESDVNESKTALDAERVPHNTIEQLKKKIVTMLSLECNQSLFPRSKARYESTDGKYTYFVTASKNYARTDQQYWYALQSKWIERLSSKNAYLCLGMIDKSFFFKIPGEIVANLHLALNKTEKSGALYWHIGLFEDGGSVYMSLPKKATKLDLNIFKVNVNV
jgi:hypothetical protein